MHQFLWESSFIKAYKKLTKSNNQLKERINSTLEILTTDPFNPQLKTHKLHGKLSHLLACSVDHNYRIIFVIKIVQEMNFIVLIDIGTHYEVY